MKKLSVNIEDEDFKKFGFSSEDISFDNLRSKIEVEYTRDALKKCSDIATRTDLSAMSLDDVNEEIKAARNAKNRT